MTVVIDTVEYDDDEEVDGSPDWDQLGVGRPSIAQGVSTSLLNGLAEALKFKGRPLRRALSEPPGSEMTVWRVEPSFVASWSKSVERARDLFVSSGASKSQASKTAQRLVEVGAAAVESGAGVYLVEQI